MAMNLPFSNKLPTTPTLFGELSRPLSRSRKIVSINNPSGRGLTVKRRMPTNPTQARSYFRRESRYN